MGYPIYGNLHIDISLTKTIHFLGIPPWKSPHRTGTQDQTDHRDGDHQGEQSLGAGGDD